MSCHVMSRAAAFIAKWNCVFGKGIYFFTSFGLHRVIYIDFLLVGVHACFQTDVNNYPVYSIGFEKHQRIYIDHEDYLTFSKIGLTIFLLIKLTC